MRRLTLTLLAVWGAAAHADTIEAFTSQLDTSSRAMQAWKEAGRPTTYLVERRGRIVASAIGGREFD